MSKLQFSISGELVTVSEVYSSYVKKLAAVRVPIGQRQAWSAWQRNLERVVTLDGLGANPITDIAMLKSHMAELDRALKLADTANWTELKKMLDDSQVDRKAEGNRLYALEKQQKLA